MSQEVHPDARTEAAPPPTFDTIICLIGQLRQQVQILRSGPTSSSVGEIIERVEGQIQTLQTLHDPTRFQEWLSGQRIPPGERRGLSWRQIERLPDIATLARQQFVARVRSGREVLRPPYPLEDCIHPRMRELALLRYVVYYGALPHHIQIPAYFAMQLYAELELGLQVDYHDRRPGGGHGYGRLQDQQRIPGTIEFLGPPPRRRRTMEPLVPWSTVQGMAFQFGQDMRTVSESLQRVVEHISDPALASTHGQVPTSTYTRFSCLMD